MVYPSLCRRGDNDHPFKIIKQRKTVAKQTIEPLSHYL
ncbi:hypothetical protein KLVAMA180M_17730 [Klebsiella variicola subsp. variicola]|nr:Uncharacterised protein [Klebsiella pneumoniae]